MFFRRKGYLRKEFDENLVILLEQLKQEWLREKRIVENSLEPSYEVLCHLSIVEAKYFYMLREAKNRKVIMIKR
ncbi:YaaL family protein [Bacillus sp. 165]|uniref:YaaL family protein n=1 Tax=Bacillus sp. 165 TaxID=1529117 RepID=UPI001AD99E78|nr:YaaL family protein [Bacillus sp. 165]MBO9131501.1 YaaL family protein [Bacillus sp. 165]